MFEFEQNEYFTNSILEKVYKINNEMLIESIQSTKIDWKEGKNIIEKTVVKNCKNKSNY